MTPPLAQRADDAAPAAPPGSAASPPGARAPALLAFALHLAAAIAFGAAFALPFVGSDFEVTLSADAQSAGQAAFDPCGALAEATGLPLPEGLCAPLRSLGASAGGATLDATLGEVDPQAGLGWAACMAGDPAGRGVAVPGAGPTGAGGPGAAPDVQARLSACAKTWIIHKAGVPVGTQTLPDMLRKLWASQEQVLFALVLAFSVVLPLVKVALGLGLSARPGAGAFGRATLWLLRATSRFAMTDVFVVALLIVFFRAETLNFRFHAEAGALAFAAGALLSSLALWALERRLRRG